MKKRLLIHNGSISIGGQEKMLVEFLKALSPEKYEVLLLIEQNIGDGKSYIEEIPKWIRYSFLTSQNFSRSLEKSRHSKNPLKRAWYSFLLREKKRRATREIQKYLDFSDIIIDYNMGLLRNLHKLNLEGKILVGWSHAGNGEPPKSKQKRENQERYDYIVTINERMKRGFEKNTTHPKIEKLYNFMGLENIVEKSEVEIAEDFRYILSVGSLTENKNQSLLIDVFSELKKEQNIPEKLVLIGEGKERESLENKIKNLGMEKEIFLLGARLNPYNYIKRAELYIVTSKEEGFSLTTLEAMALKTMVIATKTDGTREILGEDSKYGKLVENNKEELKKEIAYYLKNIDKRREYEELAYKRAHDFSKENAVAKIEEFIDKL